MPAHSRAEEAGKLVLAGEAGACRGWGLSLGPPAVSVRPDVTQQLAVTLWLREVTQRGTRTSCVSQELKLLLPGAEYRRR